MHPLRRLTAAYQAELSERVVNVRLGGSEANLETIGNFLVAESIADELDDFQFALSQGFALAGLNGGQPNRDPAYEAACDARRTELFIAHGALQQGNNVPEGRRPRNISRSTRLDPSHDVILAFSQGKCHDAHPRGDLPDVAHRRKPI